jgi:hypothetical protein
MHRDFSRQEPIRRVASQWLRRRADRAIAAGLILVASLLCASASEIPAVHSRVLPLLKTLPSVGRVPATNQLNLVIALPWRDSAGLSNLLREIYDPRSPRFHQFLTPAQVTERFGPSPQDYQALIDFARAHRLNVTALHPNRLLLDVQGSAGDIEAALHVRFNRYRHPVENRLFYAADGEPSLDFSVPVLGIRGLDNFARPQPHVHAVPLKKSIAGANATTRVSAHAQPLTGSGPNGTYLGLDFRAAYAPNTTLDGAGQSIGLLQFDGYDAADIIAYEDRAGLPHVPLQNVLLDGSNGHPTYTGGEVETALDIEMAICMATNVSAVIVYEAGPYGSWEDILNRMATDNLARQLSCCWYIPGGAADPVADQIFQQMAAQGQSFFNASGDHDAYTGQIDFPGDTPYITQVGGTTLNTTGPAGAWTSETTWNWGNEYAQDGIGSGGGTSTQYAIPNWQTNLSYTASLGSTNMRNTPDVAMVSDNIYIRADGADYSAGGTSCAAPLWAGFAALANQQAAVSGEPPVGFINPAIYALATGPAYASAFHDIVTGNNTWSASPDQFYAVPGYDLCTGLGTPQGQSLINLLANPDSLEIVPAAGFNAIGGPGGPFTATSQTYTLTNLGTNALPWTITSTSAWLHVSSANGVLLPGGPAAVVSIGLTAQASNLAIGTYYATVTVTNLNDNSIQARQFSLGIISPPQITAQPTNQAVLEGVPALFSVQAAGGLPLAFQWQFNGTNLTDGGNITGSATTNLSIAEVSDAEVGNYSVIVTNYAGSSVSSNASLAITPSAPVIVSQPAGLTANAGTMAAFSVAAVGSSPIAYQWTFNATNITDATNSSLTLFNVQLANAGNYAVILTNSRGSTLSSNAVLIVNNVPLITGLNPPKAVPGAMVSIAGINFAAAPVSNIVYFGAVKAQVSGSTTTNLMVTVPVGATYAPVTVTLGGLTAASGTPFLPLFPGIGPLTNSSFAPRTNVAAGSFPEPVVIGDLDGDGKPDLVAGNSFDHTIAIYRNLSTNGTLSAHSFAPPVLLQVGGVCGLALADLDGDGRLDIVATDTNHNVVTIFQNLSQPGVLTSQSFSPAVNLPVDALPAAVVVGDLDGDGRPEIITVNQGSNSLSVLQNLGPIGGRITTNSFAAVLDLPTPNAPTGLAIGDLDGDGKLDLATANQSDSSSLVSVFQNASVPGTIAFAPRLDVAGDANDAESVAIGDLDGDGNPDLLIGSFNGQIISVYLNASTPGSIAFGPPTDFAAGGEVPPDGVALADLDGDGSLEVAVATQNPSKLSIFPNASSPGLASLGPRLDLNSGYNPAGVAIADLIGDGRPDLVCANAFDFNLSLYQNLILMGTPPSITQQPTNQLVSLNGTATFAAGAAGSPPLSFQWWFDQTNALPDATNATLVVANVQATNVGGYSVTVSNAFGSAASSNALLIVIGQLDHFAWSNVPSPRFASLPFKVTLQARDAVNGLVTNFTGAVGLSSTNGIAVNSSNCTLVAGAWTGPLEIGQPVTNLVLQAADTAGHLGLANPINIVAAPALSTGRSSGNLLIFWPVNPGGFVLEESTSLAAGKWAAASTPPLEIGNQYLVSVQFSATNQYFRLRYTLP